MSDSAKQPRKASDSMDLSILGSWMLDRFAQFRKQPLGMTAKDAGSRSMVSPLHSRNEWTPNCVRLSGKVMLDSDVHPSKA